MSIEVKNVVKVYGEQRALDDVTFTIPTGSLVGFLGPNGAGKSTMMKIITCFIPQTSGEVKVCGLDVNEQSIEVKRKVGYLPENNPLYLEMYVKEYLGFIAGLHGIRKNTMQRIDEMIEKTGLTLERKKKIGTLSKGYRQRVGLAQAMIHDPEVLILDEPTSGLDPNQLVEIRELIRNIGKEKTVMLSTHIMQEVEAICDRVIIIDRGKMVADDTPKNLQSQGTSKNVIRVEFEETVNKSLFEKIEGISSIEQKTDKLLIISHLETVEVRKKVLECAVQNELSIITLQNEQSSLEESFQKLTGNKP